MPSRLERYEAKYRSLIDELDGLGFISPGSLVSRETSCGKPGCRCQGDPPRRHGPYFQWSRLKDLKRLSRLFSQRDHAMAGSVNWRRSNRAWAAHTNPSVTIGLRS